MLFTGSCEDAADDQFFLVQFSNEPALPDDTIVITPLSAYAVPAGDQILFYARHSTTVVEVVGFDSTANNNFFWSRSCSPSPPPPGGFTFQNITLLSQATLIYDFNYGTSSAGAPTIEITPDFVM